MSERLRLTEILTTGTAVANFLGEQSVSARHLLQAIRILQGEATLDDLGRPQSPMLSRVTKAGSGVDPAVRALAQRWFAAMGSDALAEFDPAQLEEFREELERVDLDEGLGQAPERGSTSGA